MRAVFSAMRRSFASIAICSMSSRRGARSTSRSVLRTGILASRRVSAGMGSSSVMTRAPLVHKRRGEPASRLPSWNPIGSAGSMGAGGRTLFRRLLCRSLRHRDHRYVGAALGFGLELHFSIGQCEQRVILAYAHVLAGVPLGAALARKDIAGEHHLAAEQFHAQAPARRIAAVARRTTCFLVSHGFACFLQVRLLLRFRDGIIITSFYLCLCRRSPAFSPRAFSRARPAFPPWAWLPFSSASQPASWRVSPPPSWRRAPASARPSVSPPPSRRARALPPAWGRALSRPVPVQAARAAEEARP